MTGPETTQSAPAPRGALGFELATVLLLSLCVVLAVLHAAKEVYAMTPGYFFGAAVGPLRIVAVPYCLVRLFARRNGRRRAAVVALAFSSYVSLASLAIATAAARTSFANWPPDRRVAAESSAARIARIVGSRPADFSLCETRRLQVSFVNLPEDPPLRFHGDTHVVTNEDTRKRDTVVRNVLRTSWPAVADLAFDTLTLVLQRTHRSWKNEQLVHVPREQAPFDSVVPASGMPPCVP